MTKPSRRAAYISTIRCDICGRFISIKDLEEGLAQRILITPDSYYSKETYDTYHTACNPDKNNGIYK